MSPFGTMRRRPRPRPKRRLPYRIGPFIGMRDSKDPASGDPSLGRELRNVYPLQAGNSSSVVGRPGFESAGSQLGSAGARTGQLLHQFTKIDGTQHTVAVVGGKFYTFNWTTATWSEVLAASDFTGAAITLSATARCYAVTFNDKLIVSDGVNAMWAWDGTAGGGLTKLTNAPVIYGQPTVRSAKLVGIKNASRSTIVWSEENQPNVGYEATIGADTYNNAWDLIQTDEDFLTAVVGTNEALYVFRERSSTVILGDIADDFRSTSTDEAISESIGTASPASVLKHKRNVYFVDADGRPHVIVPSLGLVERYQDAYETINVLGGYAKLEAYYDAGSDLLGFCYSISGDDSYRDTHLMYDSRDSGNERFVGIFVGYQHDRIGTVADGSGRPVTMHLDDGYVYVHGHRDGSLWDDELQGGTVAIRHIVESSEAGIMDPFRGVPDFYEKDWDRIDLAIRTYTPVNATVRYRTPRGLSTVGDISLSGSGRSRYGFDRYGAARYADLSAQERHTAVGINANGRWLALRVEHAEIGERFGFNFALASAVRAGLDPGTP